MSSLKKNILFQSAYKVLISVAPLLTTPYLSRILGPSALGVFSYRQSIINLFLLFAMLGISNYGVRTVAEAKSINKDVGSVFCEIYSIQVGASLIAIVGYVIYLLAFCKDNILVSWIFLLYLIGALLDSTWFFFGIEDIDITSISGMIIKLVSVVSVFVFVKSEQDLWIYALIVAGGTALGQIIVIPALLHRITFSIPQKERIKQHIKPILVLFIPLLAISVYHIMDKIMLGMISDSENNGYYCNADKVINIPIVLITGVHSVFFPRISASLSVRDEKRTNLLQNDAFLLTSILMYSIACGIAAVSDDFVPLFFGNGYDPCISLIKVFAIVMLAKSISSAVRNLYIMPSKKDKIYVISVFCGAIVNLICNTIFIYFLKMGALGATLGTLIAEGTVAVIEIVSFNKISHNRELFKNIIKGFPFAIVGGGMYISIQTLRAICLMQLSTIVRLMLEIGVGVAIYFVGIFLYSLVTKKNLFKLIVCKRQAYRRLEKYTSWTTISIESK